MRRYWYSILLTCSIVVMATANLPPNRHSAQPAVREYDRRNICEDTSECDGEYAREYTRERPAEKERMDTASEGQSRGQDEAAINTQLSLEITEAEAAIHTAEQAQRENGVHKDFSDTLFIGDSRTVGLSEYGDLGKAVVFADSGMSVFNLLDAQVSLGNGHKQNLDQVLSSANFKTIYLMLGINELGYEDKAIITQYRSVVERIRAVQPAAALVLEANLHVTGEKAAKSNIFNNQRIDALNKSIKKIAEDTGCRYIDVNSLFDDENGNLSAAYSTDGAHILGKYYSVWVEWIRNGG